MSVRQGKMEKIVLVIGVIGADVHAIGNKILEDAFSHAGFKVVNIGVLSSQKEFIQAAIKSKAEAILVSSLYGQAEIDSLGMRQGCIEAGLDNILLYIGGNIVVGKQRWEEVEARFKELGFDRVYPPGTSPLKAIKDLRKDLKMERRDEESSSQ